MSIIRKATSYQVGICDNPKCRSIHFELCDEDGEPFARATIGIEDVRTLTERMRDMAYEIATTKQERPPPPPPPPTRKSRW